MSAVPQEKTETTFGVHKGLPILSQSAVIQKGNRVVSQTMGVVSLDVEPNGNLDVSARLHQHGEKFECVTSKDDPTHLLGYERVIIFDMIGAAPDARPGTGKQIETMMAKVADAEEKRRAEKAGQFRLAGVKPVPDDEDEVEEPEGKIRQFKPED